MVAQVRSSPIEDVKDENKKIRKAKETMEFYAPLADRMGTVSYTHLTLPTNTEV